MYDFKYHRPKSIDKAIKLLKKADDGTVMSGGQTLIPTLKARLAAPSDVIDLSGVDNSGIEASADGVTVKAGTTHADVASNADVQKHIPALAALAGSIGDPHVRHRGTIGGSIANNDPAADYPGACLGLNATIVTNEREIDADKFFTDMFETDLEENEIVTEVRFPVPARAAYCKFPNPASRYSMVGAFVSDMGGGNVRVAITGAGPCAFRAKDMEGALGSDFSAAALDGVSIAADDLNDDIHASSEYRAHLCTVMAKRAVEAAG
ncbi:MAG: FAD binding domain-containing protein [Hyphomicrobiales bacterium]